jgi:Xaa-Pro aminopeptidase
VDRPYHRGRRTAFGTGERPRLFLARQFLNGKPFTHLFLSDPVIVEYLSGFCASNAFCLLSRRANVLFSDFRYKEAAEGFCRKNREWIFVEIKENDFSFLGRRIPASSTVGYQSGVMTVDQFRHMRRWCRKVRFVKLPPSFEDVFVPRLDREIWSMTKAARIGDQAFRCMLRRARTGMTEKQVAALLETYCRENGSEKTSFDTIVLFGSRSALPHGQPSNTRLRRGDFVLCDFGCTVDGFASDMTRTFVMGKASGRMRSIYAVVQKAQQDAVLSVTEGVRACEVDRRARDVISSAGYGRYFGHATGHGIGRRVHEKPRISRTDKTILHKNTVVTVEPGIYIPGFGGVRIEDMVAVTQRGRRLLTASPRHLIEVKAGLSTYMR